jgi:hypothetical protein
MAPELSIVVAFHDMRREAERTLFTLSPGYQNVAPERYEVVAVDNGSARPLDPEAVRRHGPNFRHRFHETDNPSPAPAINQAIEACSGDAVMVLIDGAHMLTPGVVGNTLRALAAMENAFVTVVGFHLGGEIQNKAVAKGYDQRAEDELLASVDWQADGYELFRVGLGLSYDCAGWFGPLAETNCFALPARLYKELGGLDERFAQPGGGLAILHFFRTALETAWLDYVVLLGEGTFHQFHGGVASNATYEEHPWAAFHEEYARLTGREFAVTARRPVYFGAIPPQADRWARLCAQVGLKWWEEHPGPQAEPGAVRGSRDVDAATFFPAMGYAMEAARLFLREGDLDLQAQAALAERAMGLEWELEQARLENETLRRENRELRAGPLPLRLLRRLLKR